MPAEKPAKKKPRARKLERDRATDAPKKGSTRHSAAKAAAKKKSAKKAAPEKSVKHAGRKAAQAEGRESTRSASSRSIGGRASSRRDDFDAPRSRATSRDDDRRSSRSSDRYSDEPRARRSSSRDDRPTSRSTGGRTSSRRDDFDAPRSRATSRDDDRRSSRSSNRYSDEPRARRSSASDDRRSSSRSSDRPTSRGRSEDTRGGSRSGSRGKEFVRVEGSRPTRRDEQPARARRDERIEKAPTRKVNVEKAAAIDPELIIDSDWASLGVAPALIENLVRQDITKPFPIQAATLPDSITGRDVLGRGQTGSGKTLAFGLAVLSRLAYRKRVPNHPLAIILVPTRELAMQVNDALTPLAHSVDLDTRLVAGGMPYAKQIDALNRGVQILIATPGRLTDLVDKGHASLNKVEIAVLDEADQMSDMGFMPQVIDIMDLVKPKGQRLLFSATLDNAVSTLVHRYLTDPIEHATSSGQASVSTMKHYLFVVHREDKNDVVAQIAAREGKTIFFVRTQLGADRISGDIAKQGVPVSSLHGGKKQGMRTRTINMFREGVTNALVATDVAARGIHVDDVSLVVHIDPPTDHKDYLHRAGRTARAGQTGAVVTLVGPRQQKSVTAMMARAGVDPEVVRVRPMSEDLVEITGADEPSGIAWKEPEMKSSGRRGGRPGGSRSGDRGGREGGRGDRGGRDGGRGDRGGSREVSRGDRAGRSGGRSSSESRSRRPRD